MSFFIPTAASGNGLSLATFGRSGEIMGFFYPRIDFAQNVREGMPAVRIIESPDRATFLWCFHESWRVAQSFERASNVLITRLAHRDLDLSIEISDCLPPGEHALFRNVTITKGRHVSPVQFMHYFRMAVQDTAPRNGVYVLHPPIPPFQKVGPGGVVVQHYRNAAIAVGATDPFAAHCSTIQPGVESPTKAAMQSGKIGGFHQAIGRVDFAIAFEPIVASRWTTTVVLCGGASPQEAIASTQRLIANPYDSVVGRCATALKQCDQRGSLLESSGIHSATAAATGGRLYDVAVTQANARIAEELADAGPCRAPDLSDAFERAVISLHDLYDVREGTFIAAPEFDPGYELSGGYGYCWPRDAAICALTMQQIGRPDNARRFFDWSVRTQLPNGHWYQRYWTDGSPAPAWCLRDNEIQLDQTCAMLHSAGQFARRLGNEAAAFIKSYVPTAERAAQAILACIDKNGLHKTATDLWENCTGSFAYTQAAVIAALREADEVFAIEQDRTGPKNRTRLRDELIKTFWKKDRRRWLRRITPEGKPDATLDSSAMGVIDPWSVLDLNIPADRALAIETLDGIGTDLRSSVKAGGAILRFQGESYMGGGPGCVNTLWLALCWLRLSATAADAQDRRRCRNRAMDELRIALANTSPTGQLPELIPKIKFDYWAAPHAWASSLLIEAVLALRTLDPPTPGAFKAERAHVRRRAPSR